MRRLIWKLAKNDFKKRFAGSYMGVLWALVQPLVTVGMYYIVFDKLMSGASRTNEAPFVLFLTAGLVPWFFFNEALNSGTGALREYDYLVKKIVFKVDILPVIKVTSALFIHAFFILILVVVAAIYGYYPSLSMLQLPYYSACLYILVLGLCYLTSAIAVFFKDLSQIIQILLQIGMWATPILWDMKSVSFHWVDILKLNPLYYIVEGYRDAVYRGTWFFENIWGTLYFWAISLIIFSLGRAVFGRLKMHFADVL